MTVLITMAGLGSRFADAGYQVPKYRIRARGRTLFDWSLLSMQRFFEQKFVFACLANEDMDWILNTAHELGIREAVVAARPQLSAGQAETAYDALKFADPQTPLWIYNIDTYVDPSAFDPTHIDGATGCVPVFPSSEPNMSFVAYDDAGLVRQIAEKKVISNWATVGLYGFASAKLFGQLYYRAYLEKEISLVGGERYIAPMYDLMLAQHDRVVAPKLANSQVHILGTPAQVLQFDKLAQPPEGY